MLGRRIPVHSFQALKGSLRKSPFSLHNFGAQFSSVLNIGTKGTIYLKSPTTGMCSVNSIPKILITEESEDEEPCFYILSNIRKEVGKDLSIQQIKLRHLHEEILNCHRTILASGNGLVCLRKKKIGETSDFYYIVDRSRYIETTETTTTFIVCNPATGEWISVPVLVPAGQDVEVLCLYFHPPSSEHRLLLRFAEPASYAVLTLGPNTIRTINNPPFETWAGFKYASKGPVLMHGCLHWFAGRGYREEYKLFITIYNLETEEFTHIPALEDFYLRYTHLVPMGGKLCVIDQFSKSWTNWEVWVLTDYEKGIWTRKENVFSKDFEEDDDGQEHNYVQVNHDRFSGEMMIVDRADYDDISNPHKNITFYNLNLHPILKTVPTYYKDTIDYNYNDTSATIGVHYTVN